MADTSNLSNFLEDVADAIRVKKESTEQIPAANFDTEILGLKTGVDTSDATATVDDILYPKTAYIGEGLKITGNMTSLYEKTNPRIKNENLNVNKTDNEANPFCVTFDGNFIITFDDSKNFILKDKNGSTLNTKNIVDYGGTTGESIYKIASSNMADSNGDIYVCAITKQSKNVYFYIFKIEHTNKILSSKYHRDATTYQYLDIGMNVCFANKRADVLVMYSDARNTASYTAKITKINEDLTTSVLSSYNNSNLYWISSMSFNEDDSLLTYNLAHGQDSGSGFIFKLNNYTFTGVMVSTSNITYTIINDRYLIRRSKTSGTKELCSYEVTDSAINITKISDVNVQPLNGGDGPNNVDVQTLSDNYFVIYYDNYKYLYHLNEEDLSVTQVSADQVQYLYAQYNQINYAISMTRYLQTVTTEDRLVGFSRQGIDYIDTSNATATANDIIAPKTAYVGNEKITGTIIPNYESTGLGMSNSVNINNSFDDIDIKHYTAVSHDAENIYLHILGEDFSIISTKTIPITWNTSTSKSIVAVKLFKGISLLGYVIYVYILNTTSPYITLTRLVVPMNLSNNITISTYEDTFQNYNNYCVDLYKANTILPHPTNDYSVMYVSMKFDGNEWSDYIIRKVNFIGLEPTATDSDIIEAHSNVKANVTSHNINLTFDLTGTYLSIAIYVDCLWPIDCVFIINVNTMNFVLSDIGYRQHNNANKVIPLLNIDNNIYAIHKNLLLQLGGDSYTEINNITSVLEHTIHCIGFNDNIFIHNYSNDILYRYSLNEDKTRMILEETIDNISNIVEYSEGVCGISATSLKYWNSTNTDLKSLQLNNKIFYDTTDVNANAQDVLNGKTAYSNGKIIGTMPNNGELNYEVSISEQTIPAGYTSGGTIAASPLTDSEYDECLEVTQEILGQNVSL